MAISGPNNWFQVNCLKDVESNSWDRLSFGQGNFFIPYYSDGEFDRFENNHVTVKQLRWNGKKFYVVSHNITRPAVPDTWEKVDGHDLKRWLTGCTETQVFWHIETCETLLKKKRKKHERPKKKAKKHQRHEPSPPRYKYGPTRFVLYDFLTPTTNKTEIEQRKKRHCSSIPSRNYRVYSCL